jgi:hypothetical protein
MNATELMLSTRPFRFEDLNGKPEPESWGPKYSKPAKPGRKVDVDRWPSNCASGQKFDFDAVKHRAKILTEFRLAANADRLKWATGKAIVEAYKQAMAAKRERLAREALPRRYPLAA